jgi:predicted regulator of Ras-like GTPase activity (Roadblock/LC7/MglB family)
VATLREGLADLAEIEGVRAVFVAGTDGLVIASHGTVPGSADLPAALFAAIFATVDRAISHLGVGAARHASIDTTTHALYISGLGDMLLVVIADRQANSGIVRWEMRRVARLLGRTWA